VDPGGVAAGGAINTVGGPGKEFRIAVFVRTSILRSDCFGADVSSTRSGSNPAIAAQAGVDHALNVHDVALAVLLQICSSARKYPKRLVHSNLNIRGVHFPVAIKIARGR
jgi:hypothetical protein